MKENNYLRKLSERLTAVETGLKYLKEEFEEFQNNHFHAFKTEIKEEIKELQGNVNQICKKVDRRPTWLITMILSGLISLCVGLMVYFLTH